MISALPFFWTMCFILVHVIFSSNAESEFPSLTNNETYRASPWRGRSKRSLFHEMPSHLNIKIRYTTGKEIRLTLLKTSQYLANEYLPVVAPHIGLDLNVMRDIGEFVSYRDTSECSAVIYFSKFKTLYGVVGMNHYIRDLPFNFDHDGVHELGVIGEPYVSKHDHLFNHINPGMVYPPPSDADAWYNFLRPLQHDFDKKLERPVDGESGPRAKRPRNEQNNKDNNEKEEHAMRNQITTNQRCSYQLNRQKYFSETLVFVTRDIAELFERFFGKNEYIGWIVKYLIIYFNAVDMMFVKISGRELAVHINIAKIVIEGDSMPFNFISNGELQYTGILGALSQYLKHNARVYMPDSFDHVFIYTSRPILDDMIQVNGLTRHGKDLYEARRNYQFYDVVPVTVVRFQYYYADYPVAVHEIGRIFGMEIDPPGEGITLIGQCHGIMQREGSKCDDCLKWSDDNQKQFQTFFRMNRNRCFLLNEPRSLRPLEAVSKFLRPNPQCQCFGYHSSLTYTSGNLIHTIPTGDCAYPLACQRSERIQRNPVYTIPPFDGTPCGINKVCWGRRCTPRT